MKRFKLCAFWGNGDVSGEIIVTEKNWLIIQNGGEYGASSDYWCEGERYDSYWIFRNRVFSIDDEDGMQCVVESDIEELFVEEV